MAKFLIIIEPEYAGIPNNYTVEGERYEIVNGVLHIWRNERSVLTQVASFRNWNSVQKVEECS